VLNKSDGTPAKGPTGFLKHIKDHPLDRDHWQLKELQDLFMAEYHAREHRRRSVPLRPARDRRAPPPQARTVPSSRSVAQRLNPLVAAA
jgi:hypothetical protein